MGIIYSSSKCSLGKRKLKRPPKQYRRIYFVQNLTGLYFFQSYLLLMHFQRKWKSFQYQYTGTFCSALSRSTKLIDLSRCNKSYFQGTAHSSLLQILFSLWNKLSQSSDLRKRHTHINDKNIFIARRCSVDTAPKWKEKS